jgi:hypothetical protein
MTDTQQNNFDFRLQFNNDLLKFIIDESNKNKSQNKRAFSQLLHIISDTSIDLRIINKISFLKIYRAGLVSWDLFEDLRGKFLNRQIHKTHVENLDIHNTDTEQKITPFNINEWFSGHFFKTEDEIIAYLQSKGYAVTKGYSPFDDPKTDKNITQEKAIAFLKSKGCKVLVPEYREV